MLLKLPQAASELRSGWSCGDEQETTHHHNCNKSGDLVRPEELAQVTMEAVAE